MTIASALTALNTDITNARAAITAKGGTVTANGGSSQLATDITTIPSSGLSGKYQLLERVKDDNNNEIGTVSGFFTDANDVEYAVVCLDAQYRLASSKLISDNINLTNLPMYNGNLVTGNIYDAKETATSNCNLILVACASADPESTSPAISHCRNQSFTVDGITYYGQVPNCLEVISIARNYNKIEILDTSANSYPTLNFSSARMIWSCTYQSSYNFYYLYTSVLVETRPSILNGGFVCPILEIPNAV